VDRIFVLRLGRRAGIYEIGETSREEIVAVITGAEFGEDAETASPEARAGGEPGAELP
jgi:ABC-type sugar transport system ATPase subunit